MPKQKTLQVSRQEPKGVSNSFMVVHDQVLRPWVCEELMSMFDKLPIVEVEETHQSSFKTKDPNMQELVDLGYQIHSGLKFGTHYRVYNYESEHAPWLIHITEKNHDWLDVARMIRVGHGVNKTIVLKYQEYWISLEWTKP